ncbi:squalene/phytoene synthase family protein [Pelagibacteraceae bacterium]|jgi:phytoene synthase|nr:squalene/phytoene synthase family protein [Candidatus Pelagibacter bacterium]MDC0858874.1 squalene/phytoene synthase family protein [Pelagibacteraceae bacterium]MDC1124942.1 squalene/phytoene synthase family protein [Pelagibacteraceae bacterium]
METNLLKKHAKSFYWASFFLSNDVYNKCSSLYNFCRTLDDIVDNDNKLEVKKEIFLKFKKDFMNKNLNNQIINDMWSIINSENISKKIVIDLFDGVETDLEEKVEINSKKDLLVYSYRVAGTVGLMMSKILKVNNRESLRGAIDLGIAMQLTNVARDVCEDNKRNRKYIQSDFSSIKETIYESEIFYQKSFKAISSISIRSRFSVIVARRIYKKIGDYILMQKNIENFNKAGKIYVPLFEKVVQTFLSIFDFVKLLFVKDLSYYNHSHHNILEQEINLNERI